jgi:hypothetical protein
MLSLITYTIYPGALIYIGILYSHSKCKYWIDLYILHPQIYYKSNSALQQSPRDTE